MKVSDIVGYVLEDGTILCLSCVSDEQEVEGNPVFVWDETASEFVCSECLSKLME